MGWDGMGEDYLPISKAGMHVAFVLFWVGRHRYAL